MKIYTDGSYNRKVAKDIVLFASAIIVEETDTEYICDLICGVNKDPKYVNLWNVGGELLASICGIDYAIQTYNPKSIEIYFDYLGVGQWAMHKWQAKNEITQSYVRYIDKIKNTCDLKFYHVNGHTGVTLNEYCDELCRVALSTYLELGNEFNVLKNQRIPKG